MKVTVTDMTGTQHEVEIDLGLLDFQEEELNDHLQKEAGIYGWYKARWFDAQYDYKVKDTEADAAEAGAMVRYREGGDAVEVAKQKAKADLDVIKSRIEAHEAQRRMGYIESVLRAMDKNHENALNLGYNVRREMNMNRTQHVMDTPEGRPESHASPAWRNRTSASAAMGAAKE